jgi:hypothetical protein
MPRGRRGIDETPSSHDRTAPSFCQRIAPAVVLLASDGRPLDACSVDTDLSQLTAEQRQWVLEHEALWRRAHAIVARHPGMDVTGVFHVLRNLRRPPKNGYGGVLDACVLTEAERLFFRSSLPAT